MQRSTDRILTTHVGSLIRPPEIVEAVRKQQNDEPYDHQAFAKILSSSVADVVRKQAEVGIDVPDDGEFGKSSWYTYVSQRISGFEPKPITPGDNPFLSKDRADFAEFYSEMGPGGGGGTGPRTVQACTGPINYTGQAVLQRDIDNLKEALTGVAVEEAFLPVAAPASIEPGRRNEFYPTEEAFVYALADALKVEYNMIVDAGLLLQVDDAWLPALWDRMLMDGIDMPRFRKFAELRVEALNHALAGIPEEKVRYHICWGSWNGPHVSDVPLKSILDLLLKIHAQGYSIEAANPRHEHEWQVWKDTKLPEGKILIPGVISHATNIVEHPELVAWRLGLYAGVAGKENVIGSTDCGFAQGASIQRVHPTIQWAKLSALAEGARLASRELWGTMV